MARDGGRRLRHRRSATSRARSRVHPVTAYRRLDAARRAGEAAGPAMIFRQLTHDDLGCASYLIGDSDAGLAAVVDPKFDIERLPAARALPRRPHRPRARDAQPRRPRVGPRTARRRDRRDHPHPPRRGRRLPTTSRSTTAGSSSSASVTVRALHTPGHRPEHTAFAVIDRGRGDEPWAVLTGDSLFVGDDRAARPGRRQDRRRARHLPLAARHDPRPARHVRGLAGASRRLAVRRPRDGP